MKRRSGGRACKIRLPRQGRNESVTHYEERRIADCDGKKKPIWLLRLNGTLPPRRMLAPPRYQHIYR